VSTSVTVTGAVLEAMGPAGVFVELYIDFEVARRAEPRVAIPLPARTTCHGSGVPE
jgi:hypothetical protein